MAYTVTHLTSSSSSLELSLLMKCCFPTDSTQLCRIPHYLGELLSPQSCFNADQLLSVEFRPLSIRALGALEFHDLYPTDTSWSALNYYICMCSAIHNVLFCSLEWCSIQDSICKTGVDLGIVEGRQPSG